MVRKLHVVCTPTRFSLIQQTAWLSLCLYLSFRYNFSLTICSVLPPPLTLSLDFVQFFVPPIHFPLTTMICQLENLQVISRFLISKKKKKKQCQYRSYFNILLIYYFQEVKLKFETIKLHFWIYFFFWCRWLLFLQS